MTALRKHGQPFYDGSHAPRRAFAAVVGADARLLVLGSMPGEASLAAERYYAHPRNAFWPIMQALLGATAADYPTRLALLTAHGIALWDVVQECRRPGSLDTAIVPASVRANDFNTFFRRHPGLQVIAFNGAAAQALFRRHVLPVTDPALLPAVQLGLPSTSPAHARLNLAQKTAAWSAICPYLHTENRPCQENTAAD